MLQPFSAFGIPEKENTQPESPDPDKENDLREVVKNLQGQIAALKQKQTEPKKRPARRSRPSH